MANAIFKSAKRRCYTQSFAPSKPKVPPPVINLAEENGEEDALDEIEGRVGAKRSDKANRSCNYISGGQGR
jgi:hypothetical protein